MTTEASKLPQGPLVFRQGCRCRVPGHQLLHVDLEPRDGPAELRVALVKLPACDACGAAYVVERADADQAKMAAAYDAGFEEGRWAGPPVGNPRPDKNLERDYRGTRYEIVSQILNGPAPKVQ